MSRPPVARRPRTPDRRRGWPAVAAVLLLSACSSGAPTSPEASSSVSSSPPGLSPTAASASPSATSATSPSVSPSADPTVATEKVSAGTVTNTRPTSASGRGPAEITYRRKGDFGVVARLDCSGCRGDVVLTAADRGTPYVRATGPLEESYLVGVFRGDAATQKLQLTATGRWKLTLLSWNTLPVKTGKQSGRGSTVFYLGEYGNGSRVRVTYKPAGADDSFSARIFTVTAQPLIFGDDRAFDETKKVDLPAVVAVTTRGSWTVTPR